MIKLYGLGENELRENLRKVRSGVILPEKDTKNVYRFSAQLFLENADKLRLLTSKEIADYEREHGCSPEVSAIENFVEIQ